MNEHLDADFSAGGEPVSRNDASSRGLHPPDASFVEPQGGGRVGWSADELKDALRDLDLLDSDSKQVATPIAETVASKTRRVGREKDAFGDESAFATPSETGSSLPIAAPVDKRSRSSSAKSKTAAAQDEDDLLSEDIAALLAPAPLISEKAGLEPSDLEIPDFGPISNRERPSGALTEENINAMAAEVLALNSEALLEPAAPSVQIGNKEEAGHQQAKKAPRVGWRERLPKLTWHWPLARRTTALLGVLVALMVLSGGGVAMGWLSLEVPSLVHLRDVLASFKPGEEVKEGHGVAAEHNEAGTAGELTFAHEPAGLNADGNVKKPNTKASKSETAATRGKAQTHPGKAAKKKAAHTSVKVKKSARAKAIHHPSAKNGNGSASHAKVKKSPAANKPARGNAPLPAQHVAAKASSHGTTVLSVAAHESEGRLSASTPQVSSRRESEVDSELLPKHILTSTDIRELKGRQAAYTSLGNREFNRGYYLRAAAAYEESERIALELGDVSALRWLQNRLGECYMRKGESLMGAAQYPDVCQEARTLFLNAYNRGFTGERNSRNLLEASECSIPGPRLNFASSHDSHSGGRQKESAPEIHPEPLQPASH